MFVFGKQEEWIDKFKPRLDIKDYYGMQPK